jgi:DNA-binding response OmpR family regulator
VDVGTGPVHLTDREFRLLAELMRRPGVVCTREELLAEIWGSWFDPRSNVVDVAVRRLRRKLGDGLVLTVRNVGYVFSGA